jgi:uncharacterized membrane protein
MAIRTALIIDSIAVLDGFLHQVVSSGELPGNVSLLSTHATFSVSFLSVPYISLLSITVLVNTLD